MTELSFSPLGLSAPLLHNLESLGYAHMTPIQMQSLPHILVGKDVIGQGKTGSGKTAAFGLGLLHKLDVRNFQVQSLVLCPTRELADQVANEIRKLARSIDNVKVLTLCGGMPFGPQVGSLEHGAHIVVGTPGRIEEHLRKDTLKLQTVTTLVLDEADRMLDMGFQAAIDAILAKTPKQRQTLLFSATYPQQIQKLAERVMTKPVMAQAESIHDNLTIEQHFYAVNSKEQRRNGLTSLLNHFRPACALVFCNTRRETQGVADMLVDQGFSALALHGDLEQRDRDTTLVQFANKSLSILVATDVAARGLDIEAIDAVINYEIAHDSEVHLHRIGRTGRAGSTGIACSLYDDGECHKVALLEGPVDAILDVEALPATPQPYAKPAKPLMATLHISGGKKQKLRPGDILGGLTGEQGIAGDDVGKINVFDNWTFVAVRRGAVTAALRKLGEGKLKGRNFRVRRIGR